ncbi:MAG: cytidine deaminase [Litoreibacter sp.]
MDLLPHAKEVRLNAHAPYSNFKVGAALATSDGQIFTGCNVENVAYPEGTCAEAGAIAAMCAAGGRKIASITIVADSPMPVPPCGGCRQKIAEFAEPDTLVTMATVAGMNETVYLRDLLPGKFDASHMGD